MNSIIHSLRHTKKNEREEEERKTYIHTCRLSNKRVQQIQTNKRKKMGKKVKNCLLQIAKNEHVVTINFQSSTYGHISLNAFLF